MVAAFSIIDTKASLLLVCCSFVGKHMQHVWQGLLDTSTFGCPDMQASSQRLKNSHMPMTWQDWNDRFPVIIICADV